MHFVFKLKIRWDFFWIFVKLLNSKQFFVQERGIMCTNVFVDKIKEGGVLFQYDLSLINLSIKWEFIEFKESEKIKSLLSMPVIIRFSVKLRFSLLTVRRVNSKNISHIALLRDIFCQRFIPFHFNFSNKEVYNFRIINFFVEKENLSNVGKTLFEKKKENINMNVKTLKNFSFQHFYS